MIIKCEYCGKLFEKYIGEINRQKRKGRTTFFCGLSCAAKYRYRNNQKTKQIKCEFCSKKFIAHRYHGKWTRFCSRKCASLGSVTEYRKQSAQKVAIKNLMPSTEQTAKGLRSREWHKYTKLNQYFIQQNIAHQFEVPFNDAHIIVDLVLPDFKLAFEFDGNYHTYMTEEDTKRDEYLHSLGYVVHRIPEGDNPNNITQKVKDIIKTYRDRSLMVKASGS